MSQTVITLEKGRTPLSFRLPALLFGLCAFPLGVLALVQTVLASIDILLGRPFEGMFWLGPLFAAFCLPIGGAFIWCFFVPGETLEFDPDSKTLTSTRRYPFGREKVDRIPLSDLAPPEVVWIKDSDEREHGYWALRLLLPPKRLFDHKIPSRTVEKQKQATELLRDNIVNLM
ncbi:MAG: hypothetical protein ACU0GG_03195 [Paracoccaceae bacterium]